MKRSELKALVMALLSPSGIGGALNETSFKNLNYNADRIVSYCEAEQTYLDKNEEKRIKENYGK